MNDPCADFRERLAAALAGRPAPDPTPELRALAWHGHLATCASCSALLEAEQALEAVLASLPAPRLDAELARRVLARLERARADDQRLETLLELDRVEAPPGGLAAGVLARLESARSDPRLDALLDAVPAPRAPAGLEARVLSRLARHRRRGWRRLASLPPALRFAAAALVLASGALLLWRAGAAPQPPAPVAQIARPEPPPELLEALDLLESWELIASDDLDVLLASLDPLEDELLLLDLEQEPREPPPPPIPPPQERNG